VRPEIDEGEGEDVGREDSEVDGLGGDARVLSGLCVCFSDDFIADLAKIIKLLAGKVEELSPLVRVCGIVSLFIDLYSVWGVSGRTMHELEDLTRNCQLTSDEQ